jgi:hypothetical protein
MFLVFKMSFVVDIFAFFLLGYFLGYSLESLAIFFSYHLVTLLAPNSLSITGVWIFAGFDFDDDAVEETSQRRKRRKSVNGWTAE